MHICEQHDLRRSLVVGRGSGVKVVAVERTRPLGPAPPSLGIMMPNMHMMLKLCPRPAQGAAEQSVGAAGTQHSSSRVERPVAEAGGALTQTSTPPDTTGSPPVHTCGRLCCKVDCVARAGAARPNAARAGGRLTEVVMTQRPLNRKTPRSRSPGADHHRGRLHLVPPLTLVCLVPIRLGWIQ